MKIPEQIITARIQKEIDLYELNYQNYQNQLNITSQKQLEFAENPKLQANYEKALQEQLKYYDRLEVLQNVINNLLDSLNEEQKNKGKEYIPEAKIEEINETPVNNFIYKKKPVNYKQFRERFLKEWNEHRENFQTSFLRPLIDPPQKKQVIYAPLPQKQQIDPALDPKMMKEYKQKLLQSVKTGTEFLDNPYKDVRAVVESQKLEKFEVKRENVLKLRKQQAQDFAKELAVREIEFQKVIDFQKNLIKQKLKEMAVSTRNERIITKTTGQSLEFAVGEAYIPNHLKKHVSERAKEVVPSHFGLGLGQTNKSVNCDSLVKIQHVEVVNQQVDNGMDDVLGVERQILDFSRPQSQTKGRPQSKAKKEVKKDPKKTPMIQDDNQDDGDSSDDIQPEYNQFSRQITRQERQVPVIRQTKLVPLSPSLNKLTTTLQKSVLPQKLVKDSTFISSPEVLYFYNFRYQEQQKTTFTITNNSPTIQTFKINDLDEQYKNMFKLEFKPSGMLAPGQGTVITLKFQYNDPNIYNIQDIQTDLVIRHQSGTLVIPIYCYKEAFKIQIFNNYKESFKIYQNFISNISLNYQLDELSVQNQKYEIESSCLVDGVKQIGFYIINTGFQAIKAIYKLKAAGIVEIIDLIPAKQIQEVDDIRLMYDENVSKYSDSIRQQYEQYKLEQQAIIDKKKLKVDKNTIQVEENFENVTEETLDDFIQQQILSKCGEKPPPVDEKIVFYKSLANFQKNSFLTFMTPTVLYTEGKQFSESEYKQRSKNDFITKRKAEIVAQVQQELEDRRQLQLNTIDPKKKRPATPPQNIPNLMDQQVFDQQLEDLTTEKFKDIEDDFTNNFSIAQSLLDLQFNDDLSFSFQIPARTMLFIPQSHQPRSAEFRKLHIQQQLQLIHSNGEQVRKYNLQTVCKTYSSPIQLEDDIIDFKTCFWNEQYNQNFKVGLFDQSMTQTLQINNSDPAAQSRKVHISIPENLKKYVTVDQNDMILNVKNVNFIPKISIKMPSKEELNHLKQLKNELWADMSISEDKFADTAADIELGTQIQENLDEIIKIQDLIEKQKSVIDLNESQKVTVQNQIAEMIKMKQEQENSKKPIKQVKQTVTQEELEQQLIDIDSKQTNSLSIIQNLQDQIAEVQRGNNIKDFSGSFLEFSFKVKITAFNQPEELFLTIKCEFTNKNISVLFPVEIQDNHQINLSYPSSISVYHQIPFQVQNHSSIPQQILISNRQNTSTNIGFESFSEPNGGLKLLLPGQIQEFIFNYKLDIEKKFNISILVESEFGNELQFQVNGVSQKNLVEVKSLDLNIYQLALNDIFYTDFELHNSQNDPLQFTIAPSFIKEIKKINNFAQFLPTTGLLEKDQKLKLQINLHPLNIAYLKKYLDTQEKSNFQYIKRYLPADDSEYIEITAPILINKKAISSNITYRFVISQPMVHISEDSIRINKINTEPAPPPQPPAGKEPKRAPSAKSKSKQPVQIEPIEPVEPEIQPLETLCSRYILDFGQQPVGQKVKKQISIEVSEPITEFFVRENFIESYDAELQLLSYIDRKSVKSSKMLIFQYFPQKPGKTDEIITINCFTDSTCTRKINDIVITLKGEGICVSIQLNVKDANCLKSLENENLQHVLGCMNLGESCKFQLSLKSLIQFPFSAKIYQIGMNKYMKSLIQGQQILFKDQGEIVIDVLLTAEKWTDNKLENIKFMVKAGDFYKIVEILFTISPEKEFQVVNYSNLQVKDSKIVDVKK